MALHTPSNTGAPLALLSLGVEDDTPPPPGQQPRLLDGIHLRWAFKRTRDPSTGQPVAPGFPDNPGFPWYGFYLFRRITPAAGSGSVTCASPTFAKLTPGPVGAPTLTVPIGIFSSDQNLVLTEEFPAPGSVEIDLSPGTFLRFDTDPAQPCRQVDVKIGFVSDFPPPGAGGPGGPGDGPGGPGDGPGGPGDDPGSGGGGSGVNPDCGCICHQPIRPFLESVVRISDTKYRATFGYVNPNGHRITVPVGPSNGFRPDPVDRGQPTVFEPGTHRGVFAVEFDGRNLVWTLGGRSSLASRARATQPTAASGIVVTAYRGGMPVAQRVLAGKKGDVVTTSLTFEAIDAVTMTGGPARLIDLCVVRAGDDVTTGWAAVPNFPQPICLPVKHPDYPCQTGPIDAAASQAQALARIKYGSAAEWTASAPALHDMLVKMVAGGPNKPGAITEHVETFVAESDPSGSEATPPQSTDQSSLELLLAASVHPAMAQMLGLYWVDTTAVVGQSYDYLLVADYANAGGGNVGVIQTLIAAGNFSTIQAYLRSGAVRALEPPLTAPTGAHAYALPVGAVPTGAPFDAAGSVGLRWDIPSSTDKKLVPTAPILFHLWRADFGRAKPGAAALISAHRRISDLPMAAGEPRRLDPAQTLAGWPPFGLFAVDQLLPDGWYGYRVSGIDIFGRWSALSDPAEWKQWDPDKVEDRFAVHVRDITPPPPPAGIQAWALDPRDPNVIDDSAYKAWRSALQQAPWYQALSDDQKLEVIGLRVRWVWTSKQMIQAPDLREFRVYFDQGSSKQSSGDPANWRDRLSVVQLNEHVESDVVVTLETPSQQELKGAAATASDRVILLDGTLPLDQVPLDGVELELTSVAGGPQRFFIVEVLVAERKVVLDRVPALTAPTSAWRIVLQERTYQLFLPDPTRNAAFSLDLLPTLTAPIVYGVAGVSAVDDKLDTPDVRTGGALANRFGNEGPVGGPVTVVRVRREPPAAGELPTFTGNRLPATRADYNRRSFFTLHWKKATSLRTHVFRAMDETLFDVDRQTGFLGNARKKTLTPTTPGIFPADWATARRQAAVGPINALTPTSDYRTLSDDALRVLASLEETAAAFSQLTHDPLDPADSKSDDVVGPSDPVDYVPSADRGAYLDTLDGRTTNLFFYRTAAVDGAYNIGKLGISTPPVFAPLSALPVAPVIRSVVAPESGKITVTWSSSREAGIKEYHVYRTDEPSLARDVARMTRVKVEPEPDPPASRPQTRLFPDSGLTGARTYYYRVVTISNSGAASGPSPVVSARAFDEALPTVPTPTLAWAAVNNVFLAEITWQSEHETLLEERPAGKGNFIQLGTWRAPGSIKVRDPFSDPTKDFEFRLSARKDTGAIAQGPILKLDKKG